MQKAKHSKIHTLRFILQDAMRFLTTLSNHEGNSNKFLEDLHKLHAIQGKNYFYIYGG